ncbi:MAG: phage holin family protein [Cyclobacteriaceae bacterium]
MFNFNLLKDELFRLLGIDNLVKSFTEYVEARVALIKKEIRDELAHQISRIVIMVFMMLIGLLTIAFLSIALGFWLSELLGSSTYGFLSVGGLYLLFSLVLWVGRDRASDVLAENLKRKMEQKR